MLLIAGGTGTLGRQVVSLLTARARGAHHDPGPGPSPASGGRSRRDRVRRRAGPRAAERAVAGTTTVISAIHGFSGTGDYNPRTVDRQGNSNVIQVARAGAAEHFILV